MSTGIFHANQGDYVTAIEAFRRAVDADPQSGIAHYNLGFSLSAEALRRARSAEFEGLRLVVQDANSSFERSVEIDEAEYAGKVATARHVNFREFFNLAVQHAGQEKLLFASEALSLAFEATDVPLETNRALVLGLQIDLVRATRSDKGYSNAQAMRILAELDQIRERGPIDDQLAREIIAVQTRARAAMDSDPHER